MSTPRDTSKRSKMSAMEPRSGTNAANSELMMDLVMTICIAVSE